MAFRTIDGSHTVIATHFVYYYTITNYANPSALIKPIW